MRRQAGQTCLIASLQCANATVQRPANHTAARIREPFKDARVATAEAGRFVSHNGTRNRWPRVLPSHQSLGSTSPPAGVQAAHQVWPLIDSEIKRTLASTMQTLMFPEWGLDARVGSQLPRNGLGRTKNLDDGPMLYPFHIDTAKHPNSG
jgi:hypothetical protein